MPQFFIRRPIFAWVVAIFIVLAGVLSIPQLPVAQYPPVAPPQIVITATYPGATPEALDEAVVSMIERELNGVDDLLYFESTSDTSGTAQITVTFEPGTDPDLAQVDVQNRLSAVTPRLPEVVRRIGLSVKEASSGFLMVVSLLSESDAWDAERLGDYMARHIADELRRVEGVGRIQQFSAEQAMRIWLDPERLVAFGLSAGDVSAAIAAQNALVAPGRLGGRPTLEGQMVSVPLRVDGQLRTPEEFGGIILRSEQSGGRVFLRDVARIEVGPESYRTNSRLDGEPVASLGVQLAPGANAVATADRLKETLERLSAQFPDGMVVHVPYDKTPFVNASIEGVIQTLFEAMGLVFVVMFLFLQKVRYTFIPAIVIPVALLGSFAVMLMLGASINMLTMFGMVLAIGIIVDDAIVVVENVERIMAEEGLGPREATEKAMREITGAVIGITLVLAAVFIPMALASGSVGIIFRQFTIAMATSILFSAFLALSLTPALCATILEPITKNAHGGGVAWLRWFNRLFDALTNGYARCVRWLIRRRWVSMLAYAGIVGATVLVFLRLPSSFLPEEDQGFVLSAIQLPAEATMERTREVVEKLEHEMMAEPAVKATIAVLGFGFSGAGQNAALAFTMLEDFEERDTSAHEVAAKMNGALSGVRDGWALTLLPPPVRGLGTATGFNMRLEERGGRGQAELVRAKDVLLAAARESAVVQGVRVEGLPAGQVVSLEIDRQRARAMGVSFAAIRNTISTAVGSAYINDFPNRGRMQRVIVQGAASARMQLEKVLELTVNNAEGAPVPLSTFVTARWETAPMQYVRYNGYPTMRIAGSAAPGHSSGEAMAEMERLAKEHLDPGFVVEWTGQSFQERLSAAQAPLLLGLALLVVLLVLAALYESWSLPLSVILVVPLGVIGAVLGVMVREMPNGVFFQVGLVTIIGLSAKNAILIVEFAKQLHEEGMDRVEAAVHAARLRFRPILMTSFAFILGVLPLVIASGAAAETRQAIGTGVFYGMLSTTILGVLLVPVFFVVVMGIFSRKRASRVPEEPAERLSA